MDRERRSVDAGVSGPDVETQQPALAAANEALAQMRLSMDSPRSPSPAHVNGFLGKANGSSEDISGGSYSDDVQVLQEELHKTKQEYDTLTSKYNTLVAKLSTMRSSVEGKLKRDAEELDRREQHIQQLNAQNADLELTVETLKDELIHSNSEAERSSRELESLRARILHEGANEAAREREFVELQSELERSRIERDEFEHALMTEKIVTDEIKGELTASGA
ncbi:hypothetical protein M422DRAFT_781978 [Sphaerobolus stellatus SS14]|uniref:Uncharacterized protein n=1 Tax=Sphaerobolus stellatus (strain SS14) TaxID=990650 RepID=A0A0C9VI47_SPHS4|nr:hypothetical protein M422DRAFT_781978 [Sphaerobolus stellatus SS14]